MWGVSQEYPRDRELENDEPQNPASTLSDHIILDIQLK